MEYILALDQGTTSSRSIIFDKNGDVVSISRKELTQIYPKPGWVEQNPEEIWETQLSTIWQVIAKSQISPRDIKGIGITNQRETTVLWDKHTGKPIANAIVWQCRRTAEICEEIRNSNLKDYIYENTGLMVDAYFSASKIKWLLDEIPKAREKAEKGDLLFGTIDSWLIWNLTNGEIHATDFSNASRTMLYNIKELCWDSKILDALDIPDTILPEVKPSSGLFGHTADSVFDGREIPIAGVVGDQQAALFGQACFDKGMVKNTYGTGCFMLMNTGDKLVRSHNGLISTIAWGIENKIQYALEGSIFVAGAVVQWLRDELNLIDTAEESGKLACSVSDTGGVYIVPAFVGLGAPYWDMGCRGSIHGLTRGTGRAHIIRAALESIAYQTKDVLEAMESDSGFRLKSLKVDGGAAGNDFMMQFQSDILNVSVERPMVLETTALGAAFMAGMAVGVWVNQGDIISKRKTEKIFSPQMTDDERKRLYSGWKDAVKRTLKGDV